MRHKNYNPYKQSQRRYKNSQINTVNELAVVRVFGDTFTHAWHRPSQQIVTPQTHTIKGLFQFPHPWNIACIIACRTPQGGEWARIWDVGPDKPEHHSSIVKDCERKHLEVLRTTPKHQQLNGCWIGTPTGEILSDEEIGLILNAVRIWSFSSLYEFELEQAKEQLCT